MESRMLVSRGLWVLMGDISPSSFSSPSGSVFDFGLSFSFSIPCSFSGRAVMNVTTSDESLWYSSIVLRYAVKLPPSLPLSALGPSNTRTGYDGSRASTKHDVTCSTALVSAPSIAITKPLVACLGLERVGGASGGLILASTRILLRTDMDMTIASTDFAWVVPGDSRARGTVCRGGRVSEESG